MAEPAHGWKRARRNLEGVLSSELAYVGAASLSVFLYVMLAFLSLAPSGIVGKMSTIQFSVQRNSFLKSLLDVLGFNGASNLRQQVLLYVLLFFIAISYFWLVYIFSRRRDKGLPSILSLTLAVSLILTLAPPILSRDIFSYIYYGRIATVYGNNPYLVTPQKFLSDPLFPFTSLFWKNTAVVYGPFFTLLSMLLTSMAGESITANIYFFKAVIVVFNLGNILLIWYILGRIAPRRQRLGTMVYAWNPLILIHSAGGAHNDVVMMFLALAALALLLRGRKYLGFAFLSLSFLVKYVTVILIASYLIFRVRNREREGAWGRDFLVFALIFAVLFAVFYLPFWDGYQTFKPLVENLKLRSGIAPGAWLTGALSLVLRYVFRVPGGTASSAAGVLVSAALMLVFLRYLYLYSSRCRRLSDLPEAWFLVFLVFLVTRSYLLSWYTMWVFAFLPLREWDNLSRGVLFFGTFTFVSGDITPYSSPG